MKEKVYFDEGEIRITSSVVTNGTKTVALRQINSFKANPFDPPSLDVYIGPNNSITSFKLVPD